MARATKRGMVREEGESPGVKESGASSTTEPETQPMADRRQLRSRYLAMKNLINGIFLTFFIPFS